MGSPVAPHSSTSRALPVSVPWRSAVQTARACLFALSLLFLLLFLYVALRRMHYPFEIERMESGMLTSVWWIRNGHPLYGAPTMTFVPFLYGPVFLYVSALVSRWTGIGYGATRLVSTLSTLGSCAVLYAFVWKETQRHLPAVSAAGLFLSMYSLLAGWYDLGRVDSLSVFCFLLALFATRFSHPVLAAAVWVLAFQTKQGFLPLPPLLLLFEWRRPRRMLLGIGAYLVMALASVVWLDRHFHGWYSFYVFGTAARLAWVWRQAVLYLPNDLFGVVGIALCFAGVALLVGPVEWRGRRVQFYGFTSFFVFALIGFVRGHAGAVLNAVMPAYAWAAVLFGVGLHRVLRWAESLPSPWRPRAELAVLLLASAQLFAHIYNPGRWVPSPAALGYRTAFLEELRHAPGDVWVVNHSWDSVLAGKPVHPELDAFDAVVARPVTEQNRAVVDALHRAYADGQFSAVILDHPRSTYERRVGFGSAEFLAHYPLEVMAAGAGEPLQEAQPVLVYAPCSARQTAGDPFQTATQFLNAARCTPAAAR